MSDEPTKIAVKRDGPRGWHYIARENYDPAVHELADASARDPLDHDGDGTKGGSLPKEAEADVTEPVEKPKRTRVKP